MTPTTNNFTSTNLAKKQKNIQANKAFFGRWSRTYDSSLVCFWMRHFQFPALQEIKFHPEVKILDLSCGTGELLGKLWEKSQGKANLYGLDISERMLDVAREKLPRKITLVSGDVHQLPFDNAEFDYVLSTEAFHHYHSQSDAVAEMKRVLKQDGQIIVVDVNFVFSLVNWLFQKLEPGCVKINSKREMRGLFRSNGIKTIKQKRNFLFAIMTIGQKREKQ